MATHRGDKPKLQSLLTPLLMTGSLLLVTGALTNPGLPSVASAEESAPPLNAPTSRTVDPLERVQDVVAPPAAATWASGPIGTTIVLYRGSGCGQVERLRGSPRRLIACAAEERVALSVGAGGAVSMAPLAPTAPRMSFLPAELALQWRTCPWAPVAALEREGSPFVAYEDPKVGRCYVWRPFDAQAWAQIQAQVRGDRLEGAHPYLAAAVRELAIRAARVGIEVRILQSTTGMTIKREGHKSKAKKGRRHKPSYRHPGGRYTYLHPWGLAVDLTLGWKRPLMNPSRQYHRGTSVWFGFRSLGAWAHEMGLVWLGATMRGELAHFEFHPDTWGSIDGADLRRMLDLYRSGGVRGAQETLRYSPETPSPFQPLRDPGPWPE